MQHPFLAPLDMDIIKLTAQFVARNGQKFLVGLTQREARNPQFDFLKPSARGGTDFGKAAPQKRVRAVQKYARTTDREDSSARSSTSLIRPRE